MNKEKAMKTSWYIFLAALAILTILFFLDIKFVVLGLNILVLDMLTAGIWAFVRLCRWAGRENTGKRTVAVIAITLVGLFAVLVLLLNGEWYGYAEGTEPQTHRTFVVEYRQNMLLNGTAKVYERFGPLLFPCGVPEYSGYLALDKLDSEYASVFINEEQQAITVSLFIYGPRFHIPLELTGKSSKSPEQLLAEQPKDDTHGAFLVNTGGDLGTLLITAELDEEAPTDICRATVQFTVWNPDGMGEPLQTIMAGTDIFRSWSVIDANFDGYMDFTCTYLQGNQPYYNHLWIWNEYHKRFDSVPEYDEISDPTLDAETGIIYGFNRSSGGGTGVHTFHQWEDWNHLVCMRQIDIYGIVQSDTVRMSIWDRVAGELAEIYHEDFPSESGGWLDAEMIWHDLDYHGEPGGIYDIFQQQTVDDTHDAFLVSTGGELGTLLITAELAGQSKDEFGTRDITFSVWNLAEMERPIQTFSEEVMMGVAPEFHHTVDANFDGFQDFGYLFHAGNQPYYRHYWLWDEEQRQFQYCAPLVYISQPGFDPERQVITGWARSSGAGDGVNTFHRWEDGELVCVRRIESHDPWEEPSTVSVMDRINGELQRVYYEEFPWSSEELEGQEAWRQARYKWCDLDYHGES